MNYRLLLLIILLFDSPNIWADDTAPHAHEKAVIPHPGGLTPRPLSEIKTPPSPELFFEYSFLLDDICWQEFTAKTKASGSKTAAPVKPKQSRESLEEEIAKLTSQVDHIWKKEGSDLMVALKAITGKGLKRKEETISLVTCPKLIPMSSPLIIHLGPYMKEGATDPNYKPEPIEGIKYVIFHELMHRFLVENYKGLFETSPLLEKYKKESFSTQAHLHLNAIMKSTLLLLGREDDLKKIIKDDSALSDPGYKRAWDIVLKEGHEKFVAELKR